MEYSDEAAGAEAQYPLMQRHLGAVEAAASAAREKGGAVFVHCTTGANRSGALAAALLMKLERVPLLAAVRELHAAFPLVLQGHDGFVEQLVDVADAEGLAGDGQSTVASQLASASSAFQSDVFEGPATPMRPARGRRAGAASALPSSPSVAASRSPAAGNTSQPAASAAVSAASRRSSAAGDAGGLSEAKRAEWVARLRELAAFDKHFTALNRPARITERLYLGNAKAARNLGQLRDLGVTHVVNCAPVQCKIQPSSYEPLGIHVMSAAADDDPEYPIIRAHAADVSRFVDSAAAAGGAALVHCFQGVNRSAALVVAHLLLSGRVPLADAVRTVHTARPIILSNEGFVGQLVDLAAAEGLLEGAASDSTDGAYDTASFDAASAVAEVLAADGSAASPRVSAVAKPRDDDFDASSSDAAPPGGARDAVAASPARPRGPVDAGSADGGLPDASPRSQLADGDASARPNSAGTAAQPGRGTETANAASVGGSADRQSAATPAAPTTVAAPSEPWLAAPAAAPTGRRGRRAVAETSWLGSEDSSHQVSMTTTAEADGGAVDQLAQTMRAGPRRSAGADVDGGVDELAQTMRRPSLRAADDILSRLGDSPEAGRQRGADALSFLASESPRSGRRSESLADPLGDSLSLMHGRGGVAGGAQHAVQKQKTVSADAADDILSWLDEPEAAVRPRRRHSEAGPVQQQGPDVEPSRADAAGTANQRPPSSPADAGLSPDESARRRPTEPAAGPATVQAVRAV
eukprot:TRINITY_DN5228_c0_g1_i4.p1 TRINITY_DN5228_c0_g1~~TRINITY_DN5228_c0_g1_i4.p1  ORF type:complete len:753 (+),score=205.62 TRINITY_DN5228_c0_g1_i4:967-3225(+)